MTDPNEEQKAERVGMGMNGQDAYQEYEASLTLLGRFVVRHGWRPRGPMVPGRSWDRPGYYSRWHDAAVSWHEMNRARKATQPVWRRRVWSAINGAGAVALTLVMLAFGLLIVAAIGGNLVYFGHVIVTGQP